MIADAKPTRKSGNPAFKRGKTLPPLRLALTRDLPPNEHRSTLQFCYGASRLDGNMIGWLPFAAYDKSDEQGRLLVLFNNDDLVGFVLFSPNLLGELRILQIWVRADARMILHGKALVQWLEDYAQQKGLHVVRLWCAIDLEANTFWRALHFRYVTWRWGRGPRDRRHALWVRHTRAATWSSPLPTNATQPAALVLPTHQLTLPPAFPEDHTESPDHPASASLAFL